MGERWIKRMWSAEKKENWRTAEIRQMILRDDDPITRGNRRGILVAMAETAHEFLRTFMISFQR